MKDTERLSVICTGLVFAEEDDDGAIIGYSKSEYCLDNLKDLQRFLRRDDPQRRDVFKQICKWNTVSHDLVPIIEHFQNDRNLVLNAVKILVFLTMPIDPASDDVAQQIDYLWDLKAALTRSVTIAVIVSLLEDPLGHLESDAFTEEDWKLVQLVLTLFRNILAVQDITLQQKASGLATRFLCLTDRFVELLFQENVMDLILVLTQHVNGSSGFLQEDNLLLLEIFHYIFLGRDPEMIAKISKRSCKAEESIKTFVNSLESIMEKEKRKTISSRNLERHSQFSGTFTRLTMDGSKTLFKRNPASVSGNGLIRFCNIQHGPQKRIAWEPEILSSPKESILELLYNFLNQFISGGFNVLMRSVRDDIRKEHQSIQKNDVVVFFRVVYFVLAFQHQKVLNLKKHEVEVPISDNLHQNGQVDNSLSDGDVCGPIAATINEAMFNLVISKWLEAFEGLKETNDYKSLSAAGSLMKNMIRMLDLVLKLLPEYSKETQTARVLLYKLFYDQTDQGLTQFLFNLFKSFNSHKQPKSDLADLLEMIHIILRLMEKLQARGTLRVARKSRKGRKKKILAEVGNTEIDKLVEHTSLHSSDDQTKEIGGHTSQAFVSNDLTTSQLTESLLIEKGPDNEGAAFSNQAADIGRHPEDIRHNVNDTLGVGSDKINTNLIDLGDEKEDSSSDDDLPVTSEVDFNISKLVASFANHAVVQNLCWLLKYYKTNSVSTNHHILCMLRRICDGLEMSPLLYQLSILKIFYDILAEQRNPVPMEYANITSFLTKFIRKMLKLMKKRPLLFVEILFWKTRRDCHCINADALEHDIANLKKDIRNWDGDEVAMSNEMGPVQKSLAESLGDDEADIIIPYDPSDQRNEDSDEFLEDFKQSSNRSNIVKSVLNNETGKESSKDNSSIFPNKTASRRRKASVFDQEQEIAIKNLYDKYKDDRRCSRLIAEDLDPDGNITPVQVYRKLKQLGLKIATNKSGGLPLSAVEEADCTFNIDVNPNFTNEEDTKSSLDKSSSRRKRVRTFNKAQENKIKILFEQFKGHEDCSQMIAKALDADNSYTAAQVSLKLEQLGLVTPRVLKSTVIGNQFGDNGNIDRVLSDEETLLSIRFSQRKKKRSMEEKLASIPKSKEMVVEDHSADETLRSLLDRRKKTKSVVEAKLEDSSQYKETSAKQESENEVLSSIVKNRDSQHELDQSPGDRNEIMLSSLDDDIDMELDSSSNRGQIKDLEDDTGASADRKIGYRRNLKLVIDEEDE